MKRVYHVNREKLFLIGQNILFNSFFNYNVDKIFFQCYNTGVTYYDNIFLGGN